jgi:hypothetical protein
VSNAQAARRMLAREPVDLHEIDEILEDIASATGAGESSRLRAMFKRGSRTGSCSISTRSRDVLDCLMTSSTGTAGDDSSP